MIATLLHHKIGKANIGCTYGGFFSGKCLSKPWKTWRNDVGKVFFPTIYQKIYIFSKHRRTLGKKSHNLDICHQLMLENFGVNWLALMMNSQKD